MGAPTDPSPPSPPREPSHPEPAEGGRRPFVLWSDDYEVGVALIDDQHRLLVELVNELADDLVEERDRDAVLGSLRALLRFTAEHFATEERLMSEYGGGEGEAHHRAEHRRLFEELRALSADVDAQLEGAAATMRFLRDWLLRHIELEDRPFSAWLRQRGVE